MSAEVQQVFFVAPDGNDRNPGTEARPFATLERARAAVRQVNRAMTGGIHVVLRGGTYGLERTFTLESKDSGTRGHQVIYKGRPGETPVLSGGRKVTGWQPDRAGCGKAQTTLDNFPAKVDEDERLCSRSGRFQAPFIPL